MEMISSNQYKEMDKNKTISELLSEKENATQNTSNREPFKLSQLKYTKYHWMSGEIVDGCPITTSIEIKPEMLENKWKVNIIHKYMMEDDYEEKTINKQYELPNQETILEILENNDLRDLKNNYFSNDKIQRYSHWELEYNNYFKISGTFDNEPEQVKKIISILNCENIINEALEKVSLEVNQQKKELNKEDIINSTADNNGIDNSNSQFNLVLKIEHMLLHNAYGIHEELERNKPNIIVNEYDLYNGMKIDLDLFKIEVLKINENNVDLKIYDNKCVLNSGKSDFSVDYTKGDSIGNIRINDNLKLCRDIYDVMESWNIALINKENNVESKNDDAKSWDIMDNVENIFKDNINYDETTKEMGFYKKNENDTIWWIENPDTIGEHLFSFDKKKIYNLFKDYPYNLTVQEVEIFDKENPYWANFFKDRK